MQRQWYTQGVAQSQQGEAPPVITSRFNLFGEDAQGESQGIHTSYNVIDRLSFFCFRTGIGFTTELALKEHATD